MTRADAENDTRPEAGSSDLGLEELQPRVVLAFLVGFAIVLTCLLRALTPTTANVDHDNPISPGEVARAVQKVHDDKSEIVLVLLGDSTLGSTILEEQGVPEPESQKTAAWLRRLLGDQVSVHDLSRDGMLPEDMEPILESLTQPDEKGFVRDFIPVIELSPRYLSAAYAGESETEEDARSLKSLADWSWSIPDSGILEHRFGLAPWRRLLPGLRRPESVFLERRPTERVLGERLRIARHFLEPAAKTQQLEHLDRIVSRLEARGKGALFFATPINRVEFRDWDSSALDTAKRLWRERIVEKREGRNHFVDLDDGYAPASDFLDHVHLNGRGNERLAGRLVTALRPWLELNRNDTERSRERDTNFPESKIRRSHDPFDVDPDSCLDAAFLNRRMVLLEKRDKSIETLDLVSGASETLERELTWPLTSAGDEGLLSWRRPTKDATWELLHIRPGEPGSGEPIQIKLIESKAQPWPWARARDLRYSCQGNQMVLIHDGQISSMNWVEGQLQASAPLPEELAAMSPLLGDKELYFHDAQGGAGTRVLAISFGDLLAGRFDAMRVLASVTADPGTVFDRQAFLAQSGLRQDIMKAPAMPFRSFERVWFGRGVLYFDAPSPISEEARCLWRLHLQTGLVYALLEPDARGLIAPASATENGTKARVLGLHPESGFCLMTEGRGLLMKRTRLVRRMDWVYGAPPSQADGTVVANGFTYEPRRPEQWRLGLFGSSLVGASYPLNEPGNGRLRNSLSLATRLTSWLDRRLGRAEFEVQVLDFSQAQADLLRSYVTLLSLDANQINCAVIAIDAGTLWNPDDPRNPEAARTAERFSRVTRDERGRPRLSYTSGFRPRAVLAEKTGSTPLDEGLEIAALVREIRSLAHDRGLQLIFLDLCGLEKEIPIDPRLQDLRAALQREGLMRIDAATVLAERGLTQENYAYRGDRHFRPEILNLLAQVLSHHFAPFVRDDRERMPAVNAEKLRYAARELPFLERRDATSLLDALEARAFGIALENTMSEDAAGEPIRLIADLGARPADHPRWRQALALLGLRSSELRPGRTIALDLLQFASYDEYGRGRGSELRRLGSFVIRPDDQERARQELRQALEADQPPGWLQAR